jgi:hypothetical protein
VKGLKGGAIEKKRKVEIVFAEAIAELKTTKTEKKKHSRGIERITFKPIGG